MADGPAAQDPYLALGDRARQEAEIAARAERRDRLERASEVATWRGTLRDLAERQPLVGLRLAGGSTRRGCLVALGADHVGVRAAGGQLVLVRLDAIHALRQEPGSPTHVATGDRDRIAGRHLIAVLAELVEERDRVALAGDGWEEPLSGALIGVGEDVLTLRLEGAEQGTIYLPLTAVTEVILDR